MNMYHEKINNRELVILFGKATQNKNSGNIKLARKICGEILKSDKNHAETIHLLGLIELEAQNTQLACDLVEKSVHFKQNNSLFLMNLSIIYFELQKFELALNTADTAVQLDPTNHKILFLKATIQEKQNKIDAAKNTCEDVLKLKPDHLPALSKLSQVLLKQGKYEEAFETINIVLKLSPNSTENIITRGKILTKLNRSSEAIKDLTRVVREDPQNIASITVLAECFLRSNRSLDAINVLKNGLEKNPSSITILNNLGHVLRDLDKLEEALIFLDRALDLDPKNVNANVNKGLSLLSLGRFDKAWQPYSLRWNQTDIQHRMAEIDLERWSGQTLKNKKLLVWTEQGLGDEILQASLLPELSDNVRELVLVCSDRLVSLFRYSFPLIKVIGRSNISTFKNTLNMDLCSPLLDLGKNMRSSTDSFPTEFGYIKVPEFSVTALRNKYRKHTEVNQTPILIGISWESSNPLYGERNSIPLEHWKPIFEISKISKKPIIFISCQYGAQRSQLESIALENGVTIILDESIDQTSDLIHAASQLSAVDLVISTSTTSVQLAAAIGSETWHMPATGLACGWYWLSKLSSTPWYPTMRNFRRNVYQQRGHQISLVTEALKKKLVN